MCPIKKRIQRIVCNYVKEEIRKGNMRRGFTCELCGSEDQVQGHHPDYTKPYFVIWLCSKCHFSHHFMLIEIKEDRNDIYNDEYWETQRILNGELILGKHLLGFRPKSEDANYSITSG
jgi:hypothetical protein